MNPTFSFGISAFVLCCLGAAFSTAVSAQTPDGLLASPIPGNLVKMTVDLQVPSNGLFYGRRDKLDESKIEKMGFLFFFPSNESAKINDSYPLLFFLHGMWKHDDDLEKLKIYGSPKICLVSRERLNGISFSLSLNFPTPIWGQLLTFDFFSKKSIIIIL